MNSGRRTNRRLMKLDGETANRIDERTWIRTPTVAQTGGAATALSPCVDFWYFSRRAHSSSFASLAFSRSPSSLETCFEVALLPKTFPRAPGCLLDVLGRPPASFTNELSHWGVAGSWFEFHVSVLHPPPVNFGAGVSETTARFAGGGGRRFRC